MLQILPNHPFQVRCDCESLKELAALVDFEHVVPRDHALERGAVLFRKEFYDSGLCVDGATGGERSLKAFARDNVVVVQPGSSCLQGFRVRHGPV